MDPTNEADKRMIEVPRGFGKDETGYWSTPFEYCKATCRTTSRSTQHENSFIGDRRYCFTPGARPRLPVPPAPPLSKSLTMIVGEAGASCDAACRKDELECNDAHFNEINDCNTLRSMFSCEAGCGQSDNGTHKEFPGYVVDGAAKHLWPAMCFSYFDNKKAADGIMMHFNCSASSESVQRLCPCEAAPGMGSEAAQVDGFKERKNNEVESNVDNDDQDEFGDVDDGGVGEGPSGQAKETEADSKSSRSLKKWRP